MTCMFFALGTTANAETFIANLTGAQEVPAAATTATGYARVFLNESAGTITFTVVFNGLTSNQTACHIHAPAAIGASAGVAIDFGAVGGTSGTITGTRSITPTQIAQLRAHQGYVNVHSSNFPAGEIRGQLGVNRPVDSDGDGRTDFSVLRFPSTGDPRPITFYNMNSTTGYQAFGEFGNALTDFPAPGDYDGDGKDDFTLYRQGATAGAQSFFYILQSTNNTVRFVDWGVMDDQAISRDYDGDGITDPAVFRRGLIGQQAYWWIVYSTTGVRGSFPWGTTGNDTTTLDTPVPGDYDGDGKTDFAIYRWGISPTNHFIIRRSSDGAVVFQQWGNFQTDYILPGDYDGDGKTDFCAARTGATAGSPLVWWILQSSNGQARVQTFGISSDVPTQGDYDGDARTDISVYRAGAATGSQNFYYTFRSFDQTVQYTAWGLRPDFSQNSFDSR